jgi:hypothetical protein
MLNNSTPWNCTEAGEDEQNYYGNIVTKAAIGEFIIETLANQLRGADAEEVNKFFSDPAKVDLASKRYFMNRVMPELKKVENIYSQRKKLADLKNQEGKTDFSLLAGDCFHPNSKGHQMISDNFWSEQPWFRE